MVLSFERQAVAEAFGDGFLSSALIIATGLVSAFLI
jgi:hypothetical protein